jgi:hypothetical protein
VGVWRFRGLRPWWAGDCIPLWACGRCGPRSAQWVGLLDKVPDSAPPSVPRTEGAAGGESGVSQTGAVAALEAMHVEGLSSTTA